MIKGESIARSGFKKYNHPLLDGCGKNIYNIRQEQLAFKTVERTNIMNIKICNNIATYRREMGVTQAEFAEYLGVSPQAVSKWEQNASMPDICLIPKIAFFFNISIDTLFGTSDLDAAALLVSKYSVQKNDKNYEDARKSIHSLLELEPENLKVLEQLYRLEYQRALEYLEYSKNACEKIRGLASGKEESMEKRVIIQLIRINAMLGNMDDVEYYMQRFEEDKSVDNFNYLLIALCQMQQYEEAVRWGNDYLPTFSEEEQCRIYPNLMEAVYQLGDIESVKKYFDRMIHGTEDAAQIFNAWWLLWKTCEKAGCQEDAEKCKEELLKLLPAQNYNEYELEQMRGHLEGEGKKPCCKGRS